MVSRQSFFFALGLHVGSRVYRASNSLQGMGVYRVGQDFVHPQ